MIQKIIKVGNSAAITIPKDFLKEAGLKIGDEMAVETDTRAKMVLAKSATLAGSKSLTPEFFQWLEEIGEKYNDTIKALART